MVQRYWPYFVARAHWKKGSVELNLSGVPTLVLLFGASKAVEQFGNPSDPETYHEYPWVSLATNLRACLRFILCDRLPAAVCTPRRIMGDSLCFRICNRLLASAIEASRGSKLRCPCG